MFKKIRSLLTLAAVLSLMAVAYISCRKNDVEQVTAQQRESTESRFFNSHRSQDPVETAIVGFVKRRNSKTHFVEETVKRIGYPRWDKAFKPSTSVTVQKVKVLGKNANNGTASPDNYDVYYVPFVRDEEDRVNASMVIKASASDTTIGYICDWQYRQRAYGSADVEASAERYALFFMMMDSRTLEHQKYDILDDRLFASSGPPSNEKARTLGIKRSGSTSATGKKPLDEALVCLDFYTCETPGYCSTHGDGICDYCGSFCHLIARFCDGYSAAAGTGPGGSDWGISWGVWSWGGPDSGDGGAGGGSGGYSGGSDLPPFPCDGPPSDASRSGNTGQIKMNGTPCDVGPGWSPADPYAPDQLLTFGNLKGWYWDDPANFAPVEAYDANRDGPYRPDGYRRNGTWKQYFRGTVQNWINDAGDKIATFTGINGVSTDFPGAYISDVLTPTNKAYTTSDRTIHADNTFGVADLQHEYGHVLQINQYGKRYYVEVIMPASLINMVLHPSDHKYFWTETDANALAIQFFGASSPIALDPTNFPR
jgi:hypothetical protein